MKLIFYLLYYDNLYKSVFFPNYSFCIQGMQWDTYYIKFMTEKQDGSKVEGKNKKNLLFAIINQYKYDHL